MLIFMEIFPARSCNTAPCNFSTRFAPLISIRAKRKHRSKHRQRDDRSLAFYDSLQPIAAHRLRQYAESDSAPCRSGPAKTEAAMRKARGRGWRGAGLLSTSRITSSVNLLAAAYNRHVRYCWYHCFNMHGDLWSHSLRRLFRGDADRGQTMLAIDDDHQGV